jgi:hypothetical protein
VVEGLCATDMPESSRVSRRMVAISAALIILGALPLVVGLLPTFYFPPGPEPIVGKPIVAVFVFGRMVHDIDCPSYETAKLIGVFWSIYRLVGCFMIVFGLWSAVVEYRAVRR